MTNKPLVSVIIPAYNVAAYIEESVASILNQTYEHIEVIVIDDGSSDDTYDILQKMASRDTRLTVLRNETNLKIVGTLNRALEQCHGDYVARMDGDDYKYPDAIEAQVAYMEQHPDVVLLGGAIDVCDSNMNILNLRLYPVDDQAVRSKLFRYNTFAHPAIMMRRSALEHERYELNWAEDYDLYFRLGRIGKMANLPQPVLKLRTHSASVSQSKLRYQEDLTLYIRLKAVFEYGYTMSRGDKMYFAAQFLSRIMMPTGFRFWLFNKLRSAKR